MSAGARNGCSRRACSCACSRSHVASTGTTARPTPTTVARAGAGTTRSHRGPFAVGKRTVTFTDTSRKTPANGSVPEKPTRTLETLIMYPAQGTPASSTTRSRKPRRHADAFPSRCTCTGSAPMPRGRTCTTGRRPDSWPWRPRLPLDEHRRPGGPNIADAVNEPGDVKFAISALLQLPPRQADVQRIIDPGAIAVMGTSLGAGVADELAYNSRSRDPRVKAAVEVAGGCSACAVNGLDPNGTYAVRRCRSCSSTGPPTRSRPTRGACRSSHALPHRSTWSR